MSTDLLYSLLLYLSMQKILCELCGYSTACIFTFFLQKWGKEETFCFNFHSTYLFQTTPIHKLANLIRWGVKYHYHIYLVLSSQVSRSVLLVSCYSSLICQQLNDNIFIMQCLQINIIFWGYCISI